MFVSYRAETGRRREAEMPRVRCLAVIVAAIALIVSLSSGCSNEGGTGAQPTAPDLPPLSAFVMDFTDFTPETMALPDGAVGRLDATYSRLNWGWAFTNVFVWNTAVMVGLIVPVIAFVEAFDHEPTRQPDGTWVWDYNFVAKDVVYLADLHGRIVRDGVEWEMYISKEGEYTDFLWYFGESDAAGTQGTWTLYAGPTEPTPLIGIEWHRNPETQTGDIKYTNIVPDGPENGGYIFYGTTDGTPYDAFYDIYNKGLDNHTEIEWNHSTIEGRVRDWDHFEDHAWHCWDSSRNDTDCTTAK
jgi:hypothetical protein